MSASGGCYGCFLFKRYTLEAETRYLVCDDNPITSLGNQVSPTTLWQLLRKYVVTGETFIS
jgi:hypothetical protein